MLSFPRVAHSTGRCSSSTSVPPPTTPDVRRQSSRASLPQGGTLSSKHTPHNCSANGTVSRRHSDVVASSIPPVATTRAKPKPPTSVAAAAVSLSCPICFELFFLPVQTACGHTFCFLCVFHATIRLCPVCRNTLSFAASDGVQWDDFMKLQVHVLADTTTRVAGIRRLVRRLAAVAPLDLLPRDATRTLLGKSSSRSLHTAAADAIETACRAWAESLLGSLRSSVANSETELQLRRHFLAITAAATGSSSSTCATAGASAPVSGSSTEYPAHQHNTGGNSDPVSSHSTSFPFSAAAEHAEVYFAHGYMRRRAPSIVVLRSGDEDDDDFGTRVPYDDGLGVATARHRSHPSRAVRSTHPVFDERCHLPRQLSESRSSIVVDTSEFPSLSVRVTGEGRGGNYKDALRARVAQALEHTATSASTKLPVLTDIDDEYGTAEGNGASLAELGIVRFLPHRQQHPVRELNGPLPHASLHSWTDFSDLLDDDDDNADVQDAVMEHLLCIDRMPTHVTTCKSSRSLTTARLPSADTRHQSEMRSLQKRASAEAAAAQARGCASDAPPLKRKHKALLLSLPSRPRATCTK